MKEKIKFVFITLLMFIFSIFAVFGLICFIKATVIFNTLSKAEELPYNINYSKYDTDEGLLVISGNGIVTKEVIDMFDGIEAIYVCEGISRVESDAFSNAKELKVLIMPDGLYSYGMDIPKRTELYYIEENGYREFLQLFS